MTGRVNVAPGKTDERLKNLLQNALTSFEDDEITALRTRAFSNCSNLESISLPNLTSANTYAFPECTKLSKVNLPKFTTDLFGARYMFSGCTALNFISLPSCYRLAYTMYQNCSNLVTIEQRNCGYIDGGGLSNCGKLRNLIFKNQVGLYSYNNNISNYLPADYRSLGKLYTNYSNISWYENHTAWGSTNITFLSIQENLVDLQTLGVDITEWYEIVDELPTSDISTTKVYLIETATAGTYEQHYYNGTSWSSNLSNITLL